MGWSLTGRQWVLLKRTKYSCLSWRMLQRPRNWDRRLVFLKDPSSSLTFLERCWNQSKQYVICTWVFFYTNIFVGEIWGSSSGLQEGEVPSRVTSRTTSPSPFFSQFFHEHNQRVWVQFELEQLWIIIISDSATTYSWQSMEHGRTGDGRDEKSLNGPTERPDKECRWTRKNSRVRKHIAYANCCG